MRRWTQSAALVLLVCVSGSSACDGDLDLQFAFSEGQIQTTCAAWCENSFEGPACNVDLSLSECQASCEAGCRGLPTPDCEFGAACVQFATSLNACQLSIDCREVENGCTVTQDGFDACVAQNTIGVGFCSQAAPCAEIDETTCVRRYDSPCWPEWNSYVECFSPEFDGSCEECQPLLEQWQACR